MQVKQVFSTYNRQEDGDLERFVHCPLCGTQLALVEKGGKQRPACPNCGSVQFRNPRPGAVVLVERDGQVLLGKRSGSYGAGQWGLPMGFIEFGEDFLTAAIREVKEETGLVVEIRSILSVVTNFLSPKLHTLAIVLLAGVVGEGCTPRTTWTPLSGVPFRGHCPRWLLKRTRTSANGTIARNWVERLSIPAMPPQSNE